MKKAATFVRQLGLKVRGDGHNRLSIAFPNGSRIVGLPGCEGTTRGFSAVSLLLVDEASRVKDDAYQAMRPVLAVGNGDLWLMSTPCGQRGFFWKTWTKGGEQWERITVTAPECPWIAKDLLEEERHEKGDLQFRQEYFCEFLEVDGAVFPADLLARAMDDFEGLKD